MNSNSKAIEKWRKKNRDLARIEFVSNKNRCPGCGRFETMPEVHHTFARRLLSEPLESHVTLLRAICTYCHLWVTEHPRSPLAERLQWDALYRAYVHFRLEPWDDIEATPLDHARRIEKTLKASPVWRELCEEAGL